jgi:hypothetical protein
MRRREFISLLGGAAAAWPLAARAQQPAGMRRLAVLISGITEADAEAQARVAALRLGLLEHGWIEGRNLEIDYRWGGANPNQTRGYATELVALNPDVIFAAPSSALAEVQRVNPQYPGRIRAGFRSGRRRICRQPCTSGGQYHWLCALRICCRRQVAGAAQADCSFRDRCRCHPRSCNAECDRLFALDRGRRSSPRRGCICPQCARHK